MQKEVGMGRSRKEAGQGIRQGKETGKGKER